MPNYILRSALFPRILSSLSGHNDKTWLTSRAHHPYLTAHPESDDISPLSASLRSGLIAISVFALLSFILTSTLFVYITYKLLSWHFRKKTQAANLTKNIPTPQLNTDFTFTDGGAFGQNGRTAKAVHEQRIQKIHDASKRPPNQFLILVFNLIIADMHQGAAFLLSARWIQKGGIFIDDPTCFVQGFFDSNGDLSSSLFITAIAIHTYLSVVKNYRPTHKVLYAVIVAIWLFVYSLSLIPLLATRNGKDFGGYYVRAGPWCWINDAYENLRLLTHYLFIFISLVTTSTLYISIFFSLRRQARAKAGRGGQEKSQVKLNHNPAFLIYPLIYVLCTLPLALGRIATMAGAQVPTGYYCFAGTLIASNGSFDCLLFGTTRHSIVFGSKDDIDVEDTGLETFAFARTTPGRYGNSIWIQGGNSRAEGSNALAVGGWWQRLGGNGNADIGRGPTRTRTVSQESLRSAAGQHEMAIQLDVVTSVAVEIEERRKRDSRYPNSSMSSSPSVNSGEKEIVKTFSV